MTLPPRFVIPGDVKTWHLAEYMGDTFTRLCKLWLIVNQVALAYYAEPRGNIVERTSLRFAEQTYGKMLSWAEAEGPLIRHWAGDAHHECYLHTLFHTVILDIFRPFLGNDLHLESLGSRGLKPETIFTASVRQINCK